MARFEEADPRWIVSERDHDGRNVNGWHWEEKNALKWSRELLGKLLTGEGDEEANQGGVLADIPNGYSGRLRLSSLKKLEGDACLNLRKGGKRLAVYDLSLTLEWEGELLLCSDAEAGEEPIKVKGEVILKEFASENEEEEYEWKFSSSSTSKKETSKIETKAKQIIATTKEKILAHLREYKKRLETEF